MTREERRLLLEAWQHSLTGTAKVICRAANVTAEDIADRAGVSPITAWRWMEGRARARGQGGLVFAEMLREALPEALANLDHVQAEVDRKRHELDEHERALDQLRELAARTQTAPAAA